MGQHFRRHFHRRCVLREVCVRAGVQNMYIVTDPGYC
jgi:hypothetical protein